MEWLEPGISESACSVHVLQLQKFVFLKDKSSRGWILFYLERCYLQVDLANPTATATNARSQELKGKCNCTDCPINI